MATIPFTAEQLGPLAWALAWTPLTFTGLDDGARFGAYGASPFVASPGNVYLPVPAPDRSIQVLGTFGAGGSLTFEGSNVPNPSVAVSADWATLTDPQGNPLTFTSGRIEQIAELTRWVRPRITAGDGTTSLTVRLFGLFTSR